MAKKRKQQENKEFIDHSQDGASHLTSDKSEGFKEVSFDVLENAVERRNSLFGYKSRDFRNRAIISSDEMIDGKVRDKSIGKLSVTILTIILCLSIIAGALVFLNNSGLFTKVTHSTPLKEAIVEIEDYDYPIMKLNAFLQTTVNSTKISQSNINKEEYVDVKKGLNELSEKIEGIKTELDPQSEDYLMAGYAQQAIEARLMMIDTGLKIYDKLEYSVSIINNTEAM